MPTIVYYPEQNCGEPLRGIPLSGEPAEVWALLEHPFNPETFVPEEGLNAFYELNRPWHWNGESGRLKYYGLNRAGDCWLYVILKEEQARFPFKGYVDEKRLPIKPGQTVTIKKGTRIRSMHPTRKHFVAGRTYRIKVHHLLSGCNGINKIDFGTDEKYRAFVENPKVRWPGAGGYWCEADINDVPEARP